jgi:hypothetical protein
MERLTIILYIAILSSCINREENSNNIEGMWVRGKYSDPDITFMKTDSLTLNNLGFELGMNNHLTRVQPVGGCGTEPIDFEKVDGQWGKISDTTFYIEYDFWQGKGKDIYYIKKLNQNSMILELLDYSVIRK